jgi:hypothetical protein
MEQYYPPFIASLRAARSVMAAYNSVDGSRRRRTGTC